MDFVPWNGLNDEEFDRLFRKAKQFADRFGFRDEAEDFAQEYCLSVLTRGKPQSLKFFLIDYSEKLRAHKRVLGSPQGYLSKNVRVSLDEPRSSQNEDGPTIGDALGNFRDSLEHERELALYHSVFTERERVIFDMICEGFNLKDVGEQFGVSESRVSQWMRVIESKVRKIREGSDVISGLSKHIGSPEARKFAMQAFSKSVKGK